MAESIIRYKGWEIEPQSYQSADGRWHPKATASVFRSGRLQSHPVFASFSMTFESKELADAYAVKLAKTWIDAHDRGLTAGEREQADVSDKLRVLCVDDDPDTNHLHAFILGEEADMEVVGTVAEVEEVLPALATLAPEVVLLDLGMGRDGSLSLLGKLVRRTPPVRVVVVSGLEEPALIKEVLGLGASGYVTKGVGVSAIAPAIRKALRGERPIVRSFERR